MTRILINSYEVLGSPKKSWEGLGSHRKPLDCWKRNEILMNSNWNHIILNNSYEVLGSPMKSWEGLGSHRKPLDGWKRNEILMNSNWNHNNSY